MSPTDKKTMVLVGLCPNIHDALFGERNPYRRNTMNLLKGESFGTSERVVVDFYKVLKYGGYGFNVVLYSYSFPETEEEYFVHEKQVIRFNADRTHAFVFLDLMTNNGQVYGLWTKAEQDQFILDWQTKR